MGPIPSGSEINNTTVTYDAQRVATAARVLKDAGWVYDGISRQWKNKREKSGV